VRTEPLFVIDLATCTGCQTCRIACHDRAGTPDSVELLRVEAQESGSYPAPTLTYRVTHCLHCEQAPCIPVCPVSAIKADSAGWVLIDARACIGCGACINACPFGAITLLEDGAAVKCDGCHDEVLSGWEPSCVRACPMRALHFGAAPDSLLEARIEDPTFDDHGAGPRVRYLRRAQDIL